MGIPGDTYATLRANADAVWEEWNRPLRPRINLAEDTSSLAAGAHTVWVALNRRAEERGAAIDLGGTAGYGLQWLNPLADITWPDGTRILYGPVTLDAVDMLIDEAVGRTGAADRLAIGTLAGSRAGIAPIEAHPFLAKERERRLTVRVGRTDPASLEHYIATGGYFATARALDRHMEPQAIRQVVIDAGLWGRGGAAFPAGVKWNFLAGAPGDEHVLVCNADEGDPGGWANRVLLEGDPHLIVEGMLIAALASNAHYGYIYIRSEYPLAVERMRAAIRDAEAAGILGNDVLGSGFRCTFEIVMGAGAYVCGDETGLISSLQDGRGMPRIKPPFPANAGVLLKPTNVNNVETYANVPLILMHGAEWYRQYGTQADSGTKIFSLSGNIDRVGWMETPFGTPLKAVLAACGGVAGGGVLKAIQPGGPLIGYLPGRLVETLTLERAPFAAQGAGLGSGGIVFIGAGSCSVDLNVLFAEFVESESCGRCTTCHGGNQRMHEIFRRTGDGLGRTEDRHNLELIASTLQFSNCAHGQLSPTIMRNTLRHFEAEYNAHLHGTCEALRCPGLARFRITDQSDPRLVEAQAICPTGAIVGEAGNRIVEDSACIRCGACTDVAPRAIVREAAPAGTELPRRAPAAPPGTASAFGVPPMSWQATGLARPEGGMGGPAPITLFV